MTNIISTTPLLTTESINTTQLLNVSTTDTTWNITSQTTLNTTTTPTTSTPVTSVTTSDFTNGTTTHTYPNNETKDDDGSAGQIGGAVGGAIGGVIVVALIVVLVIFMYRRQKKLKKPKQILSAPGIEDLDKSNRYDRENSEDGGGINNQTFYLNIDEQGRPNENTDPALEEDGYMKKPKKKKGKKKKEQHDYARQNSIPMHPAPPVPVSNIIIPDYENTASTKKLTKDSNKLNNATSDSEFSAPPPKAHTGTKEPGYVNSGRKQKSKDKQYANLDMSIDVPDQKHYENVEKVADENAISEELYENT